MKPMNREEMNRKVAGIDGVFHQQISICDKREYQRINDIRAQDHPSDIEVTLIARVRRRGKLERKRAYKQWLAAMTPLQPLFGGVTE